MFHQTRNYSVGLICVSGSILVVIYLYPEIVGTQEVFTTLFSRSNYWRHDKLSATNVEFHQQQKLKGY